MKVVWPKKILAALVESQELPGEPGKELPHAIEEARREWLSAQNYYNSVSDTDLVDHAVFMMQAAEKKYTYLLKRARKEGVTYQPYRL